MTIGQEPRQEAHAYPPVGYAVPPPSAYGVPTAPQQRRRGHVVPIAVAAGVLAGVLATTAAVAVISSRHASTPAGPAAVPPPQASSAPAPLTPEAAQAQTCAVLKADYETVANAIDARNTFNSTPWSDPAMLAATNNLVAATGHLADSLETSLNSATPPELRSAVIDYVTGLRALSISQRNHARDLQLNGSALLYNQVVDAPLQICGIPG